MLLAQHNSLPLQNLGVVVTRPAHQAEELCQMLENLGARAIRFPVLEILESHNPTAALGIIQQLDQYDLAIFTSANAVHKAMPLIQRDKLPSSIAAIGKATTQALAKYGVSVRVQPPAGFSSEALLALPQMQKVANKRIVIVRGEGGRELLGKTLAALGAHISYAEVYRRGLPITDPGPLIQYWQRGDIQAVIVTSNEGLRNLFAIVGNNGQQWLYHTPLIVVSMRAGQLALELGVHSPPLVAKEASNTALIETLLQWHQTRLE